MKRACGALIAIATVWAASATLTAAQLLVDDGDLAYLHRTLSLKPDNETLCRLTKIEAVRLHRLIRAGDAADVKAYFANVFLDQLFDEQHHIPRADACH